MVLDDSNGFWRRVRLIPFLRQFPTNLTFQKELVAEGPGILAWAVQGCLQWQRAGGLLAPSSVTQATEAYERDSDPLTEFLEDACRCGDDLEQNERQTL